MEVANIDNTAVHTLAPAEAPTPPIPRPKPHLTITPSSGWQPVDLRELWQYRDLLLTLAARDVKLRYRQTALGAVWVVLGPLMSAGVLSFIFGKVAKLPSEGVPYFLFAYVGLMGWGVFSGTLGKVQGSLVGNAQLVSKIYFPRMILPLTAIFSTLIDLGVGYGVLAVLMALCHVGPHVGLLLLPLFIIILLVAALAIGLIVGAVTVKYRDAGQFIGPPLQAMMYGSPVLYAMSVVPDKWRHLYYLNPMASLIQAYRWSLLGTSAPPWGYVGYSAVFFSAFLVVGMYVFRRMERGFADVI